MRTNPLAHIRHDCASIRHGQCGRVRRKSRRIRDVQTVFSETVPRTVAVGSPRASARSLRHAALCTAPSQCRDHRVFICVMGSHSLMHSTPHPIHLTHTLYMPSGNVKTKTKGRRSTPNYAAYIHKILKQVHPDLHISSKSAMATNYLVDVLLGTLTSKSSVIANTAKKSTLSARHVQGAVRLCMPHNLCKHAVSEGTKAVTKFASA